MPRRSAATSVVEVLAEIESQLSKMTGRGKDFRLADYFDFVAGTSTGAIIAACISVGMTVSEIHALSMSAGNCSVRRTRRAGVRLAHSALAAVIDRLVRRRACSNGASRRLRVGREVGAGVRVSVLLTAPV